jgi:hypothetical protein
MKVSKGRCPRSAEVIRVILNVDSVAFCGNAKMLVTSDRRAPCGNAFLVDKIKKIF